MNHGCSLLPGNTKYFDENLHVCRINEADRIPFLSADRTACLFSCMLFTEHPKLCQYPPINKNNTMNNPTVSTVEDPASNYLPEKQLLTVATTCCYFLGSKKVGRGEESLNLGVSSHFFGILMLGVLDYSFSFIKGQRLKHYCTNLQFDFRLSLTVTI